MPSAADLARAMHEVTEPINSIAYFAPECTSAWEGLGIEPAAVGYFPGRAAPLGRVDGPVVAATFFNFNPALVTFAMDVAWKATDPETVLAARAKALVAMFQRLEVPTPENTVEATDLLRAAMDGVSIAGRPLGAACTALPATGQPLADLWQAVAAVREFRGDGHVALLTAHELTPVEALVLYSRWQERVGRRFLQASRGWDNDAWQDGIARLTERGLVDQDGLTAEGTAFRTSLELKTDAAAAVPWSNLGVDRCRRLFDLLEPVAKAAAAAYPRPFEVTTTFPDN